jgi:hypothetical protein
MLDEKAFFITINQGVTLSLQTCGMTVKIFIKNVFFSKKLMFILADFRKNNPCGDSLATRIYRIMTFCSFLQSTPFGVVKFFVCPVLVRKNSVVSRHQDWHRLELLVRVCNVSSPVLGFAKCFYRL